MADMLSIGVSGLSAAQQALATTGNNISNANTPGYSRQVVNQTESPTQLSGGSYLGSGVNVSSVTRVYNQFLVSQALVNTSAFNSVDTFQQLASTIDNVLGDPTSGLSTGIDNFFNAVQQVANDPSQQAARQSLLSQANTLVSNFQNVNNSLNQGYAQVNAGITDSVSQINALAQNIANLNTQIATASGSANSAPPNDLLDQRDTDLTNLANLVSVSTVNESNGAVNVFIGSGQSLVVGSTTRTLSVIPNQYDATRDEVGYVSSGGVSVNLSGQISGGALGGYLNFRSQVLDPAKNTLGQTAIGMASAVNTQQTLGMDLNGNPGGNMFTVAAPVVSASNTNTGTGSVSGSLVNANALTTSNYNLVYNGANSYTLTRLSDGKTFAINTGGSATYTTSPIDGVALTINSGAAVGDSYLIQPTVAGVDDLNTVISDPSKIAAATPVAVTTSLNNVGTATASAVSVNNPNDKVAIQFTSTSTYNVVDQTTGATLAQNVAYTSGATVSYNGWTTSISDGGTPPATGDEFFVNQGVASADSANTGGATISQAVVSPPDPTLTDQVTITFNNPPTSFNVVGATTGSPTTNIPYTSGGVISYNGWNLSITGVPTAGDSFTVGPNTNGVGDGSNMQQIAAIQNKMTLNGGTATIQDVYGQIVANVGTQTQQATTSDTALQAVLQQSNNAVSAVSGVNLDEEAANMLKYQQAYQASAQIIATAQTLFNSLLSAVGGS